MHYNSVLLGFFGEGGPWIYILIKQGISFVSQDDRILSDPRNWRLQFPVNLVIQFFFTIFTLDSFLMSVKQLTGTELEEALGKVPSWTKDQSPDAIKKTFTFNNFVEAFGFMSQVALIAEKVS